MRFPGKNNGTRPPVIRSPIAVRPPGLEPGHPRGHQHLKLARLPFRHGRRWGPGFPPRSPGDARHPSPGSFRRPPWSRTPDASPLLVIYRRTSTLVPGIIERLVDVDFTKMS